MRGKPGHHWLISGSYAVRVQDMVLGAGQEAVKGGR